MWMPVLSGLLDRRMLLNYRISPEVMQRCLPAPFRPQVVNGFALAGVCLIRMNAIGPRFLPFPVVRRSENAALRFAVEWETDGRTQTGVYIPERYTTSRLAALAGMRFFPGKHSHASLQVVEQPDRLHVELDSDLKLSVTARPVEQFSGSRVFDSVEAASRFFQNGEAGYSEAIRKGQFDGVKLKIFDWRVEPLQVEQIQCNFFDERNRFPAGTVEFDCALLMRHLKNEFHILPSFCCQTPKSTSTANATQQST